MSEKKVLESVECKFNLFEEGRSYTGNHRSYILESAKKVSVDPAVSEMINLREALGYYGHGRRILARKMRLSEVEAVAMPDGSKIVVSNIPSNVTTSFVVNDDGTVLHKQEFLDTETGKIAASLHKSKVGGFSWACPGRDGGSIGLTKITGFEGFDYVLNPGFSANRGYVLESSGENGVDRDMILESIAATGVDDKQAEALLNGWVAQAQIEAVELRDRLIESEIYESTLLGKISERDDIIADNEAAMEERDIAFSDLEAKQQEYIASIASAEQSRKDLIKFIAETSPVFLPEAAMQALIDADFDKARPILESVRKVDLTQVPVMIPKGVQKQDVNNTEDVDMGWDLG